MKYLREPDFTRVVQDMDRLGIDPIGVIDLDPIIDDRDKKILSMDVEGYDFIQVVLSRLTPFHYGMERQTYMSRHLPIEAVKTFIGGLRDEDNRM